MIQLSKNDYNRILPLTNKLTHNKALIYSVIEGDSDGKIFVDSFDNPQNAYIENEFAFIVGSGINNTFNSELCSYVFSELIPNSKDKEAILFMQTDVKDDLENTFKQKGCITIQRKMFDFSYKQYKKVKKAYTLPEGVELVSIDKDFARKYKKHNEVAEKKNRFGYCIVDDGSVLSECFSVVVGANQAEISVETDEQCRRRSYAFNVTSKFIDHCISCGITPIWSCWPFRKESIALANKLGFREQEDIPVIYWAENM